MSSLGLGARTTASMMLDCNVALSLESEPQRSGQEARANQLLLLRAGVAFFAFAKVDI